ncbi:MAG: hypothetical protein EXR99_04725, partial [Gemmataceae bacterium]|nr:hypothetical protein [Gemmataceae bacterium]
MTLQRFKKPGSAIHWLLLTAAAFSVFLPGCSRRFFRNRADQDVQQILATKDFFPTWKIENYHVNPDPRSRFASVGNPDRPPTPPDDPAAMSTAPNPQTPGKSGIAHMEGAGYLEILENYDLENRAKLAKGKEPPLKLASFQAEDMKGYKDPLEWDNGPVDSMGLSYKGDPAGRYPKPYLIDLQQSSELALVNSREFQSRREDLYVAALPVSVQRFAFAAQFYATEAAIREQAGSKTIVGTDPDLRQNWSMNSNAGVTKVFSTGALLLFKMANQAVVEMSRSDGTKVVAPTAMSLDLFQPLFQGGGRAVTLEPLTIAERGLLYEIRSYARFRKEFYANIIAGGTTANLRLSATQASGFRSNGVFGAGLSDAGAIQVFPGAASGATLVSSSFAGQREGYFS